MDALDADGVSVREALAALSIDPDPWATGLPGCFVEVHVEQGPELERIGSALAEVTSIAGMAGFEVEFTGDGGHAGTVPMALRRDAFTAAAELAVRLRDAALAVHGGVATIGDVRLAAPASNVIPSSVSLTVDLRAPTAGALTSLRDALTAAAAAASAATGCRSVVAASWRMEPVPMSDRVRSVIRQRALDMGRPVAAIPSGAGHDAGVLAAAGVETGMLFVRSRNGGVSHSPDELTDQSDIAAAIDLLAATLETLTAG